MPFAEGIALATLSAICNGSFGALSKLDVLKVNGVTPHVLNFFASIGACVSGLILALFLPKLVRHTRAPE